MIYADQRWIGGHGIGRFARNVLEGLHYRPVALTTHPASAMDPLYLSKALFPMKRRDLFFSPGYNSPLVCNAPFIFTIHDLNHIDRPENSSAAKRLYYSTVLKRACRRARYILTVSEFSRQRIIEWSQVPLEKVINVGCGVDASYRQDAPAYNLPFPYLLCVSNRKTHKNEIGTVKAFAQASLAPQLHLVFTGLPTPALSAFIEKTGAAARIHFTGHVPDAALPSLYRSATALVFVSLYEGFGLPMLEAMACGTPVVTSNSTALPEVAGGAALLVDPLDVDQIAYAMERVVFDSGLRSSLKERGLRRAVEFSWETTRRKVHALVERDGPSNE